MSDLSVQLSVYSRDMDIREDTASGSYLEEVGTGVHARYEELLRQLTL